MDLERSFGYDEELANEGVWFDAGPEARLKVASVKNEQFLNYVREHTTSSQENIVTDSSTEEDIGFKAIAKFLLLDWENVKVAGEEVEYSEEKALELMKEYPEFADTVLGFARDNRNFQRQEEEENLSDGSSGS